MAIFYERDIPVEPRFFAAIIPTSLRLNIVCSKLILGEGHKTW